MNMKMSKRTQQLALDRQFPLKGILTLNEEEGLSNNG